MFTLKDGKWLDGQPVVVLAHGAGAPMDSPFMTTMAGRLSGLGLAVLRFEFPYMARRRTEGCKAPPDRAPKLLNAFAQAVRSVPVGHPVIVAGKSMGGRMASLLAARAGEFGVHLRGWAALGYPFHPPGKPDRLRTEHLAACRLPGLVIQGARDPFGSAREPVASWLPANVGLVWIEDGNHDLMPRKSSGRTHEDNLEAAAKALSDFVLRCAGRPAPGSRNRQSAE